MKNKVIKTIEKYNMPLRGARIIVALSGGSDSMSLLRVLYSIKDEYGFTLEAAHVNHGIRGESADRDEAFSVKACENLGIECHVLRADVPALARETGMSEEEAGRKVRYDFFASFGDEAVIATAHNLNDRVETMLFNLARGSSLKGLCSIPPVRGNIVRPIIDCSKDEILAYCSENGIDYVTDETNSDVLYTRNRIRHKVITELKEVNPAFEVCAARCIDSINDDEAFLSSLARETVSEAETQESYTIETLLSAPLPVLRRAVSAIISSQINETPENSMIDEVISALDEYSRLGKGKTVQLMRGRFARTRAGILEFPVEVQPFSGTVRLNEGSNAFGSFEIICETITREEYSLRKADKNSGALYIDRGKTDGEITVRTRLEGDRITPAGRGITKPLRKLQNELGIPPEIRDISPVFCDESGIVAAFLCPVNERVKVNADTVNVLEIKVKSRGQ